MERLPSPFRKIGDAPSGNEFTHRICTDAFELALEDGFNISLETDDIVDFSSFNKGIEILLLTFVDF